MKKCRITDGVWELCQLLSDAVGEANVRRRGIGEIHVTNVKTEAVRTLCVLHRETAKERGTVLNYCPWCGANIEPKEKP